MKKVFVISAIVIVMSILLLTMTSCGDNPFQRLIQRTSPQEIIAKNVCDAIANRDSQKLYQLFSEEVKMNVPDLKEKTDKLLETYGKDSLEIQTRELSGGSDYHSGEKQSYETTLVTVHNIRYRILFEPEYVYRRHRTSGKRRDKEDFCIHTGTKRLTFPFRTLPERESASSLWMSRGIFK